jgi:hypothetical protein
LRLRTALAGLKAALRQPDGNSELIKERLDWYRNVMGSVEAKLARDRADLKGILTSKQVGAMVLLGVLN